MKSAELRQERSDHCDGRVIAVQPSTSRCLNQNVAIARFLAIFRTTRSGQDIVKSTPRCGSPRDVRCLSSVRSKRFLVSGLAVLLIGCIDRALDSSRPAVTLDNVVPAANPYNALSSIISFAATGMDSARVLYWPPGGPQEATPFYRIQNGVGRIAALGLRPNTAYSFVVEADGGDASIHSTPVQLTTGFLPNFLQSVHLNVTGAPTPGYVLTSLSQGDTVAFAIAFDQSGNVVWYREFDYGVRAVETKQQANGDFSLFVGSSLGSDATYGWYVEFKPDGQLVRTYAANPPYYTDSHELLLTFRDSVLQNALLFGYDLRRVDLTPVGGPANALVGGHSLLRQTPSGGVDFFWSAWDHFVLEDWIEPPDFLKQLTQVDFDHPNSLDIDHDGNYLVSWRSFGEVTNIDSRNGNIIWRLGGRNNQFTFVNDPLGGFSAQHSVRELDNGDLLMYDNGWRHNPPESRAAVYRLDLNAKTATLVWEFRHSPPIFTGFAGSVQRLVNGNTLIGWGFAATVTEAGIDGTALWEGQLNSGGQPAIFYRCTKISSLYEFRRP